MQNLNRNAAQLGLSQVDINRIKTIEHKPQLTNTCLKYID